MVVVIVVSSMHKCSFDLFRTLCCCVCDIHTRHNKPLTDLFRYTHTQILVALTSRDDILSK